eukprot:CAMPEP_0113952766 /NCGR_PEP_ID=MMETSP1339-20121228/90607_1 /TAXON_ID=94617 /ORGANISM="Fibrocapsa japonica" /LENGTH=206 /DNA_ID=CAMNT_0000961429 /DNA_START=559 /DNA_END=1179 /DNA_ORIENTATION=+ /assembly_acc=CAM_ASM_000762
MREKDIEIVYIELRLKFNRSSIKLQLNLEAMHAVSGMMAFSFCDRGNVCIDGTVARSCSMQPQRNLEYRKMCRSRLIGAMRKERVVKQLDDAEIRQAGQRRQTILQTTATVNTPMSLLGGKRRVGMDEKADKRVKIDQRELRSKIFEKFGERENWTFKELNSHLMQPERHLRETLDQLCVRAKKGIYELKPEYKSSQPSSTQNQTT